ncbi:MAG: polysaccharide deacetylase family protein [Clostridiales bacterium]|nr:polysaccharide deacetylase family protein [Clostridiales bacterium]
MNKAVTFSFDDGQMEDVRLVDLLNRYRLKCTFNLNSAYLCREDALTKTLHHADRVKADEIKALYKGHEVACHTCTHPSLTEIAADEIIYQINRDAEILEELCGYAICGMAYPNGRFDDRVVGVISENTAIRYARTTVSAGSFDRQEDLLRFHPTCHQENKDIFALADAFVQLQPTEPKLFYIWGHSYEFNSPEKWERFEALCAKLSGKKDIFYGTNREVLL